jgi:NAD(P) transhydrogenase subunit alpha
MVESMKPGSVIVDLASEQGGNCALTHPGQVTVHKGVTIVGYTDLPGRMVSLASQLYATTVVSLLEEIWKDGRIVINTDDQVVRGALVAHEGRVTWPPPPLPTPPPPPEPGVAVKTLRVEQAGESEKPEVRVANGAGGAGGKTAIWVALGATIMLGIGLVAPASFLGHFTVFVMACFVGWQVVWNVRPALHTPLMSVTNAISGIILIGGMLQLAGSSSAGGGGWFSAPVILGSIAVLIATINISGGFLITHRILAMFRRQN